MVKFLAFFVLLTLFIFTSCNKSPKLSDKNYFMVTVKKEEVCGKYIITAGVNGIPAEIISTGAASYGWFDQKKRRIVASTTAFSFNKPSYIFFHLYGFQNDYKLIFETTPNFKYSYNGKPFKKQWLVLKNGNNQLKITNKGDILDIQFSKTEYNIDSQGKIIEIIEDKSPSFKYKIISPIAIEEI